MPIPCNCFIKIYVGDTSTSMKNRIYEHNRNFRIGDHFIALVKHNFESKYNSNFKDSLMLLNIQINTAERLLHQASLLISILTNKGLNFFDLFPFFDKLVRNSSNISNSNQSFSSFHNKLFLHSLYL